VIRAASVIRRKLLLYGAWLVVVVLSLVLCVGDCHAQSMQTESLSLGELSRGYVQSQAKLRSFLKELQTDARLQDADRQTQLESLLLAIESPSTDRRRFLFPGRPSLLWNSLQASVATQFLLPNDVRKETLKEAANQLFAELRSMADNAETANDKSQAFPIRWHETMLRRSFEEVIGAKLEGVSALDKQLESHVASLSIPKNFAKAFANHPKMLWPAASYSVLKTTHFEIASQAGTKPTQDIAELSEFAYAVWKLVFPSLWCSSKRETPGFQEAQSERFSIAIFRDRASYVKALKQQQSNIELSTGYYDPNRKIAIFYWDGAKTTDTILHELAHQFFFEAVRSPVQLDTDRGAGYWIVEGIAAFMESTSVRACGRGSIVDVGGWDSPRAQAGRYRRLHDEYWQEWSEFGSADGKSFRSSKEIQAWYSQATGLAHFWMDSSCEMSERMIRYLESVYRGTADISLLGYATDDEVRAHYDLFLRQFPGWRARTFFPKRNEIVLSRCDVTFSDLAEWTAECRKLKWLDLSYTRVDDRFLLDEASNSKGSWEIARLNLESTSVSDRTVRVLAQMNGLAELDLSRTPITDKGLLELRANKTIRTLWLDGCAITDASIPVLESMTVLEGLHVAGTQITAQGWDGLLKKKPILGKKSSRP
jgi:hypothetical protein